MNMARCFSLMALLALALVLPAMPTHAQSENERYSIMRAEPASAPKHKSPRRTRQHVTVPRSQPAPQPYTGVPPPIVVPQTGAVLPNLPTISGSGPGGRESSQDRAVRCSHQAGVYGPGATGDRNAYIGTCINQ
jgi:hypothetical protein